MTKFLGILGVLFLSGTAFAGRACNPFLEFLRGKAKPGQSLVVKGTAGLSLVELLDRADLWKFADGLLENQIAVIQRGADRIYLFVGKQGYEVDWGAASELGQPFVGSLSRVGPARSESEHEGSRDVLFPPAMMFGVMKNVWDFGVLSLQGSARGFVMSLEPGAYETLAAKLASGSAPSASDLGSPTEILNLRVRGASRLFAPLSAALLGAASIVFALAH